MSMLKLTTLDGRKIHPRNIIAKGDNGLRLLHIGVHNSANRNAGDTALFPVVRKVFEYFLGPISWELRQAWQEFSSADAIEVKNNFDGVVIGGGGLLLRDQEGSSTSNSGWQWNSTVESLSQIRVPIFVFAVGYNRFRGQEDFDIVFKEHISNLVSLSGMFALRNNGSIRALKKYLPEALHESMRRQFCPTTLLWQLYPEFRTLAECHDSKNERVFVFNAAFDRSMHRFGTEIDTILVGLANAVKMAQDRGWRIIVAAHKTLDRDIEPVLDAAKVAYETVDLTDASLDEILKFYAEVDFVFGMRGHAQMIPFGLRRPIMSIVSHDKMRFFLEDLNRPEWGSEVDANDIEIRLGRALKKIESGKKKVIGDLGVAQSKVWKESIANFSDIKAIIHSNGVVRSTR